MRLPEPALAGGRSVAVTGCAAQPECAIHGTPGKEVIRGTPGRDVICVGVGNDIV